MIWRALSISPSGLGLVEAVAAGKVEEEEGEQEEVEEEEEVG